MNVARSLARAAYLALASITAFEAHLRGAVRRDQALIVLSLHGVSPERNDFYPPLHPGALDELLTLLARDFTLTSFDRLADAPTGRPALVLTFDDGFHDFVEHAMPVLARHRVHANLNVIASSVHTGVAPWTQRFNDLLAGAPPALLREIRVPGFDRPAPGPDPEERARYGAALGALLTACSRAERAPLLAIVERSLARGEPRVTRMMDARDVREASREHQIGAHSLDHDSMGTETLAHFAADVAGCQTFFRDTLGLPLEVYAFPNGSAREEQVDHLRGRGFPFILLVGDRYAHAGGPVFPRFNLGSRDPRLLRLEALGVRAWPRSAVVRPGLPRCPTA